MKILAAMIVGMVAIYPVNSYGVTWENYGVLGNDQITLVKYYVGSPVEAIDEHTFRIWYKVESIPSGIIITEYLEMNCKNKTSTLLQKKEININDKTSQKTDDTDIGVDKYIEPQSIYERFINDYCTGLKVLHEAQKKQD